jgi:Cft2 family RNA processing exonuclease
MLRDAMSFSDRTDRQIRAMEKQIDNLAWGFELYESFTLKHNIAFTLKNAGHILGSCFIQFAFPDPDGSVYRQASGSPGRRCLFASISNHMANKVNWAAAIKDENAANALMVGILPLAAQM